MRVCLLTPVLDAFKGGNHLPLLAALPDVRFTILTSRRKPQDAELPPHIRCETLGARLGSYAYGFNDALFAQAALRRYPPDHSFWKDFDVIHINQTMGPALLQLRRTRVPLLFFVHHPVSADCAIAVQESAFLPGLRWRLRYALLRRWQKRFCRELPHVATVSKTAAKRIADDYGIDASRIHIVPNGVDTEYFMPGDLAHSDFDVVAVGSFIHPRKGFRYLADAYRILSGHGLRIADVGRRSPEQRAELARIGGVCVFGTVPPEEHLSLLQRSAALISTSLYEGFGLSLIEALACGRPVFAFDGGAVREVLDPVDPSLVVPARDTEALTDRILHFLQQSTQDRAVHGERYHERVKALYPLSHSAEMLRALYDHIIP